MASAHGPDLFDEPGEECPAASHRHPGGRANVRTSARPAPCWVSGVVTFVVSGSLALGLQLTSGESAKPADNPAAASTSDEPAAVKSVRPAPAARAYRPSRRCRRLRPRNSHRRPKSRSNRRPLPSRCAPEATVPDPLAPVDGTVPGGAELPPGVTDPAPGIIPASPTPVPEERRNLHRLKDKLSGIGKPDDPVQAPVDVVPPPARTRCCRRPTPTTAAA